MSDKIYNPSNCTDISLTNRSDEIAFLDIGAYRAVLSCGHACDPNSLFQWCKRLLDDGKHKFTCPALVIGLGNKKCDKEWDYSEVRRLALLTGSEKNYFEEKLNHNFAKLSIDLKQCPNCNSFVERDKTESLRIKCTLCKRFFGKEFEFCWQCDSKWGPLSVESDMTCGKPNCKNKYIQILAQCKYIKLSSCPNLPPIPSIRACPTCGKLIEHSGLACKNILCPQCQVSFCFACLETTPVCQQARNGHNNSCMKPVAPIQTSIPVRR